MSTASPGAPGSSPSAFRERARLEAERYGADPWIFVRELLQNARDAGADRVDFEVIEGGPAAAGGQPGESMVICRDNGEGMSFEHARRYLFALYASSKETQQNQVGKFGVGFWSILRFEPSTIAIRSLPRQGEAWGVALDGGLSRVVPLEPPQRPGTQIVLARPGGDGRMEERVRDAVWQSARYLVQRDDGNAPLAITVNGRAVAAEFALPAPSASFRRGGVKGVVGLGPEPRVELFSRGLRVRSAPSLEDLLSAGGRHSDWLRVQFTELPGGLAPQALLESPDLELMLARSDARDTGALRKLVRLAQRELERLIERHLAAARPLPWWRRLGAWVADELRGLPLGRAFLGAALVAAVAVLVWLLAPGQQLAGDGGDGRGRAAGAAPAAPRSISSGPRTAARSAPGAEAASSDGVYEDPGDRYAGPSVDIFDPQELEPVGLRYRPPERRPYFAILAFDRLAADGAPEMEGEPRPVKGYRGTTCRGGCLQINLRMRTAGGAVRIPLPTGHRVEESTLVMTAPGRSRDSRGGVLPQPRLRASADGRPVLVFAGPAEGVLRYWTAPAPEQPLPVAPPVPASLPADLAERARLLRGLPVGRRVSALLALTRDRVAYDASPSTVARHRELVAAGRGFMERALTVGAGDCDVQNGLLTALLHAAGIPARLAVGYLGERGAVLPWTHAWVEYLGDGGRWLIADASERPLALRELAAGAPVNADASGVEAAASEASPLIPGAPPPAAPVLVPVTSSSVLAVWSRPMTAALLLLLAATLLLLATTRRTRRSFKLEPGSDLSKLLRGVLQQPAAFGHIPALFHRPLVPLASGAAISIARARDLASRGRLYFTERRPPLATDALRAGAAVLDHGSEEGRAVADALGAIDLDAWEGMIDAAVDEPLLASVNRALRRHGEDWVVRASPLVTGGLATLDLAPLGARSRIAGARGGRLVLIESGSPWLEELRRYHRQRPRAATFLILEELARRLDLRAGRRWRLLGSSAEAAVLESFAP